MRLARHAEKRGHLAKVCRGGNALTPRHGSPKSTRIGSGEGSGKSKGKSKKRTPETCLCCGKEGHKKADCKFKTATCANFGKVGHLRAVCRNRNTLEIEKDADEPSPEVTDEAVWCMAVGDTVDDGHCDCIEKHDVSSEHRDESKLTYFPEHRDESNFKKSHHEHGDGSKFGKAVTKIEVDEQDRIGNQDMSEFVQNELTDEKLQQETLKEFVTNLLMDQNLEQGKLKEFVMSSLMDQKLEHDDDLTDQNVNQ